MTSIRLLLPDASLKKYSRVSSSLYNYLAVESQKKPTIAKKVAEAMVAVREKEPKPQPKSKT